MKKKFFKTWMIQFAKEKTPFGDLANDIDFDSRFPTKNDFETLDKYLYGTAAYSTFLKAYKQYEKEVNNMTTKTRTIWTHENMTFKEYLQFIHPIEQNGSVFNDSLFQVNMREHYLTMPDHYEDMMEYFKSPHPLTGKRIKNVITFRKALRSIHKAYMECTIIVEDL
jgi:hypothetical protein